MVFSFRTIFLFIRGIDQTGRAMGEAGKGLKTLEERQKALAQASYRLLFAGAAFMAFGAMATGAILKTLESTTRGERILGSFGLAMDRLKQNFAQTIVDNFGPQLETALDNLEKLAENEEAINLLVKFAITIGPGSFIAGVGLTTLALFTGIAGKIMTLVNSAGAGQGLWGAGIIGTALTITLGAILLISVGRIAWDLVPSAWQSSIWELRDKIVTAIDTLPFPFNFIVKSMFNIGSPTEGPFGGIIMPRPTTSVTSNYTRPSTYEPIGPPSPTTVPINITVENLNTKMEDEEWLDWFRRNTSQYLIEPQSGGP